jgi:hypothetical protein
MSAGGTQSAEDYRNLTFGKSIRCFALFQREMESWRSPLVSIVIFGGPVREEDRTGLVKQAAAGAATGFKREIMVCDPPFT